MTKHDQIEPNKESAIHSVGKTTKYILIGFLLLIISMSAFSKTSVQIKQTIDKPTASTNKSKSIAEIQTNRLAGEMIPECIIKKNESTKAKNETPICVSTNQLLGIETYTNNPTTENIEFLFVKGSKKSDSQNYNFTNKKPVSVQISYSIEIPK